MSQATQMKQINISTRPHETLYILGIFERNFIYKKIHQSYVLNLDEYFNMCHVLFNV